MKYFGLMIKSFFFSHSLKTTYWVCTATKPYDRWHRCSNKQHDGLCANWSAMCLFFPECDRRSNYPDDPKLLCTIQTPLLHVFLFSGLGLPNLRQTLMPDDLRWSWCNNNRNKVHDKCNELESSWNYRRPHPPTSVCGKIVLHETGSGAKKMQDFHL